MRELFHLENNNGLKLSVSNYGGIIQSLFVPDRQGQLAEIVLGFDSIDEYDNKSPYFGAICGRYANRIANGKFSLDGTEYNLNQNDATNHLHGGTIGFDKKLWDIEKIQTAEGPALQLKTLSPDGDENYPGNLCCTITYTLTEKNELKIYYFATTDRATFINLTQHSYFNLKGAGNGTILDHQLEIFAKHFTPTNSVLIPTGEFADITNTPLDFQQPHLIGERIHDDFEPLHFAGGYDHNYVLNPNEYLKLAARVTEPSSGRIMEVLTTEPGVQFYSGNFLDGSNIGKNGAAYQKHYGLCLEAQHFPDSPNQPSFPSTLLKPDQEYTQTTIYHFSTE